MARREEELEQALRLLREGAPLEAVVARYPELAPALRAARLLERARPPGPSLRAELASRAAFLRRAEELRAARRPWAGILFGWLRYARAGAVLAGILLIAGVLHLLAQQSLPGDPLYGLKRAEERVWLALTLDPVERRLVEETLAARRWEEYRALAQRRGSGTVTWEGQIEGSEGITWRIGAIPVEVFPETEIVGPVALGQRAVVTAFLGPEGGLIALQIRAISETPTPIPEPEATWMPAETPETPTPAPVQTRLSMRTPQPTSTLIPGPAPTATPSPPAPATPTPMLGPTPTPEDHDEGEIVKWKGILQAIAGSTWIIDGRAVQVTGNTKIHGDPRIGDRVEVKARRQPDGTLVALEIERED